MNYVLKNTAYRGETETVEELYLNANQWSLYYHTNKLSEAMIWDTAERATVYMEVEKIDDHKIVEIEDKDLFEARLTGK